jgi:hemerythrin-like domain-containing protein
VSAAGSTPGSALRAAMMGVHERLDAMFAAQQRALLDRDFVRAGAWLDRYRTQLLLHMDDEERHVLPLYAARGGDASDAPVKMFLGEHARMREFVARSVAAIAALQQQPDDAALLALFDQQATYKNLLLHHDLRERNALYPRVEQWASPAELQALAEAVRSPGAA